MLYSRQLNRASGCNFNNPLLTASVSDAGYMAIARSSPPSTTVERLQIQQYG